MLDIYRRSDGLGGFQEACEKRIALGVDFLPAPALECLSQYPALIGKKRIVLIAQPMQEARGTFDIGK
jgi:hypothetical protein